MLPVRWSAQALDELDGIVRYIAQFNPLAAEALHGRIESVVLPFAEHSYLYRPGRVAGTRELVAHPNYIMVYRVLADQVEITGVLHSHSEYP